MGVLRDRMIEEMQLRNFAASTQRSYLYTVTKLAQYYNQPPDQLGKEQIRSYLLYLTTERKLPSLPTWMRHLPALSLV